MKFASIGSGSKGNGTLVKHGKTCLLIDNGFTLKDVEFRLAQKGLTPLDITAVLVTHEHGDHIKGVGPFARKFKIPVYMSHGTSKHEGLGVLSSVHVLDSHETISIGELNVMPVVVPHDAREPTQFIISHGHLKLGVLTDLGSITQHIVDVYSGCHALLLETNHDVDMLRVGPYPPKLKARVAGNFGHLSNEQAASFLRMVDCDHLQHVVATHISGQNNSVSLAVNAIAGALNRAVDQVIVADQKDGFDWHKLH